jgi:hypothetical protein
VFTSSRRIAVGFECSGYLSAMSDIYQRIRLDYDRQSIGVRALPAAAADRAPVGSNAA